MSIEPMTPPTTVGVQCFAAASERIAAEPVRRIVTAVAGAITQLGQVGLALPVGVLGSFHISKRVIPANPGWAWA